MTSDSPPRRPDGNHHRKSHPQLCFGQRLAKCTHLQALQPLLREAPVKVQKYVLKQFASILPHDVEARRAFVQNGGLQFLQELNETVGGKLTEFIQQINACYPPEIVEYYSPNYSKKLLDKIKHPFLLKLYAAMQDDHFIYFLLEVPAWLSNKGTNRRY